MSSRFTKVVVLALCALVSASCQDTQTLMAPESVPQFGHEPLQVTLVQGQLQTSTPKVTKWIGEEGGTLVLAGYGLNGEPASHTITVPAGAVRETLLFTMEIIASSPHLEVELNAFRVHNNGNMTEVGHHGFKRPVILSLSWAAGTNVTNPTQLSIIYMVDGQPKEKIKKPKKQDRVSDKKVDGELKHFSRYAMGH